MPDNKKSVIEVLSEWLVRNKPSRYANRSSKPEIDNTIMNLSGLNTYNYDRLINSVTETSTNYVDIYREYEMMERDTIIQSAIELYSDDATSLSSDSNKVVSISSEDKTLERDLNELVSILEIDNKLWNWAYQLCLYGDHYVKINYTDSMAYPLLYDYDDPACIMDIHELGSRLFYLEDRSVNESNIRIDNSLKVNNVVDSGLQVIDSDELVHFMIKKSSNYSNISLQINDESDENGNLAIRDYQIIRGSSILEPIRYIYQSLKLLEDSLIYVRLNKSQYVRVFNIEVKGSTPEVTTNTINSIKNLFDSKATFNTNTGSYQSNKYIRPHMDPIFNPVRDGLGSISIDEIGGEVNVSDIADIEYFTNKLYGGLKIPKAFLGIEESIGGGLSDNSLVHLDLRYSRSVSRVIKALAQGIKDILNLWLVRRDRLNSVNNYQVNIKMPNDAEMLTKINSVSEIFSGISNIVNSVSDTMGDYVNTPKLLKSLITVYLPDSELLTLLTEDLDKAINKYDKDIESNSVTDDNIINNIGGNQFE